jgi:hypothetical protein
MALAICTLLASGRRRAVGNRLAPLTSPVLVFLLVWAVSVLASSQPEQSLALSAPILPAALLFVLIANHFTTPSHVRSLYLTFSLVSLGASALLLWNAWLDGWVSPNVWVLHAGTPLLVVGNDVTFLALIAPLSLALLWERPRTISGAVAGVSLVASTCVIALFLSRGALLTLVVSLICVASLVRLRMALYTVGALLVLAAAVDVSLGFPLANKYARFWNDGLLEGDERLAGSLVGISQRSLARTRAVYGDLLASRAARKHALGAQPVPGRLGGPRSARSGRAVFAARGRLVGGVAYPYQQAG